MKLVLDANVPVSGLPFGCVPGRILAAWSTGAFRLGISPPILDEYQCARLALGKGREPLVTALEALLAMLPVHAVLVNAPPLAEGVSEEPDGDMFLAAAVAGHAKIIVSGDKHLLRSPAGRALTCSDRVSLPADILSSQAPDDACS